MLGTESEQSYKKLTKRYLILSKWLKYFNSLVDHRVVGCTLCNDSKQPVCTHIEPLLPSSI